MRPGDKPFIMADEFETIFQSANLINDTFIGRDCYYIFNASIMAQIDELTKDRHLKAQMNEFLEAFARAAEKISLAPPNNGEDEVILLVYITKNVVCSINRKGEIGPILNKEN